MPLPQHPHMAMGMPPLPQHPHHDAFHDAAMQPCISNPSGRLTVALVARLPCPTSGGHCWTRTRPMRCRMQLVCARTATNKKMDKSRCCIDSIHVGPPLHNRHPEGGPRLLLCCCRFQLPLCLSTPLCCCRFQLPLCLNTPNIPTPNPPSPICDALLPTLPPSQPLPHDG